MPVAIDRQSGKAVFLTPDGEWAPARMAKHPTTQQMLAYDGKDWVAVTPPSRTLGQVTDDVGRSLANGATFGFADEIAAGAHTALGTGKGTTYDENLAAERARDKEIPGFIKVPGEMAGAVGATLATAPVTAPLAVASGLSKLPNVVRTMGVGGTGGALFGAGEADGDLESRAQGALKGGAIGVGVGGVVPIGTKAVTSVAQTVKGLVSPSAGMSADLGRAIRRDELTPEGIVLKVQQLATERPGVVTIADVGGENVRGLVERVAQTPGAGRTQVIPALTDRQVGQRGRLANDLQGLTGTRQTAIQAIDDTMAQRRADATPLYDEAFNFNARAVPEVVQAWQKETQQGWGKAILDSPELKRNLQTEYGIKDVGDAPLMVLIDAWKREADGIVGESVRKGNKTMAGIIGDMRNRVVATLDQHNPKYADARNAWAGPSKYLEAIEDGRSILSKDMSAEELRNRFATMSPADQEAFRIGAVSAIRSKMGGDAAKLGDMTKYLRAPEVREKIEAIMPSPDAAHRWATRLDFEVGLSELTGKSLGNSATARRLAERQDAESLTGDLVMEALSGAPTASLWRRAIMAVPGAVRDTARSRTDALLADVLTNPARVRDLVAIINRAVTAGRPPSMLTNASAILGTDAAITGGQ